MFYEVENINLRHRRLYKRVHENRVTGDTCQHGRSGRMEILRYEELSDFYSSN